MNLSAATSPQSGQVSGGRSHKDSLVIIPTFNEAANIEPLVRQILSMPTFDVLMVDDHSPDGTGVVADRVAREFPERMAVVHRPGKQGLASAYVRGFAHAINAGYRLVSMTAMGVVLTALR